MSSEQETFLEIRKEFISSTEQIFLMKFYEHISKFEWGGLYIVLKRAHITMLQVYHYTMYYYVEVGRTVATLISFKTRFKTDTTSQEFVYLDSRLTFWIDDIETIEISTIITLIFFFYSMNNL